MKRYVMITILTGISIILFFSFQHATEPHVHQIISFKDSVWNDKVYLFYKGDVVGTRNIYEIKNIDSVKKEMNVWGKSILNQYIETLNENN